MVRFCSVGVFCLGLVAVACGRTPMDVQGVLATAASTPEAHPRQPYFTPGSEDYGSYEGGSVRNACVQDLDCLVTGCQGSTCAAEVMEVSDQGFCDGRSRSQANEPWLAECGCLKGECRWYFANDYDRPCEKDDDCAGLGPPPGGMHKGIWRCAQGACRFL